MVIYVVFSILMKKEKFSILYTNLSNIIYTRTIVQVGKSSEVQPLEYLVGKFRLTFCNSVYVRFDL